MNLPVINVLTTALTFDTHLQRTAISLGPHLGPNFRWYVWINDADLAPMPTVKNEYVKITKGADCSLYDALNKLSATIRSGYILILGAGDTLSNQATACFAEVLNSDYDNRTIFAFSVYLQNRKRLFVPNIDAIEFSMSIPHPGVLMPIELFNHLGGFDISYRISSDYDLICRAKYLLSIKIIERGELVLVNFLGGGVSETKADEALLENALVQLRVIKALRASVASRLGVALIGLFGKH